MAKQQKGLTIAETFIMSCAKAMVAKLCCEDQAKKLSVVPLSNNTICSRLDDMAENILVQVIEEVKSSPVQSHFVFNLTSLRISPDVQFYWDTFVTFTAT